MWYLRLRLSILIIQHRTRLRATTYVFTFYPTIVAIFDRNWRASYNMAVYGRLYMAEWRQRSTLLTCKWPPLFLSIQKFDCWITLISCINYANCSFCVNIFICFICNIITPSQLSVFRFIQCLLFSSIYIVKTK